jgi:hypothetical protein
VAAIAPIVDISIRLIIVLEDNKSIKGYNVNRICESINELVIIPLPIAVTLELQYIAEY